MDALLAATLRSQTLHVVTALPVSFSPAAPPAPLLCHACGAPATSRCGKCFRALYCSRACQQAHWALHRAPCLVDRRDTSEAEAVYSLNHKCRHGGPDIEHDAPLHASLMAAMPLVGSLPIGDAARELQQLCAFARATPPHPKLHRILLSCAVDALADSNAGIARRMARIAAFCCALARRPALLGGVEAGLQGGSVGDAGAAAMRALAEEYAAFEPYAGLLAALRHPMTCGCLQPLSAGALPLTDPQDPASDGEGAGGGAAEDPAPGGGEGGGAAAAPAGGAGPPPAAAVPVEAMSVKELKAALQALGVPTAGLLEKAELQAALREATSKK